jgi:glyoxylase-like metal-dependent hydrolase (beta-lactamase superfamily II)
MESFAPGIRVVAVRSPTLPPATHTNAWILGDDEVAVVDPAADAPDEQARLVAALDAAGVRPRWIVLTHHHYDHLAGAVALQQAWTARGQPLQVCAHAETAARIPFPVDRLVEDGATLDFGGRRFTAHFTPGHAPGHLAYQCVASGVVIAGDLVAGVGTIAISPLDGHLGTYLASLERLRQLRPTALLPAHGPALVHAETVLTTYLAHRHQRSEQIRVALGRAGRADAAALVPAVYPGLDPRVSWAAVGQIESHLRWLAEHGVVRASHGEWETT